MAEKAPEKPFSDIFRPPPGGDVTLRSSDGVDFLVHSVVLALASSVFEGLTVVGTNKDAVDLSETADTVSLMLRFIYPNSKPPMMTGFEMLLRCLQVAQKYDLESTLETLDEQLATNTTPQSLLAISPSQVHQLALQYNLPKAKVAAASLVFTGEMDACNPDILGDLVKYYPSASLVRIAAIQGTRAKILADVLFHFYERPILPDPERPQIFYELSCESCQKWLRKCQRTDAREGLYELNPPSWLLAWSTLVYDTLLAAPLEKSNHLFDAFILDRFKGSSNVCQECLEDFWKWSYQRDDFNRWAGEVKYELRLRLDSVRHLYAL
ncbi:hypothetical protein BDV93DRAFT_523308 [Ceratobasidium sp. AG-I]|nr:hypothetical protein BDV93DRAFT_523308 [Ceratobasidium sp. AG-I]